MTKGTHLNQPATRTVFFWMHCYQHILPASLSTHVCTCDYSRWYGSRL